MRSSVFAGAALLSAALAPALAFAAPSGVTLENSRFSLAISADGKVRSLKVKSTGEECIAGNEGVSFCQVVQDRPFGNEVKLIWPNKRSVYGSNSVEERDGALVFGFDTISDAPGYSYKAIVDVKVTDDYMAFTLRGFEPDSMDEFMDWPAVAEFRVVQLPLRPRKNFGVVMNCAWDEKAAVALMAAAPEAEVDSEVRARCRLTWAATSDAVKLRGVPVVIAADAGEAILDRVDAMERDFGLPRGVKSRRSAVINRSQMDLKDFSSETVDDTIAMAKKCGIKLLHAYYKRFFEEEGSYLRCGDYDIRRDKWPNGVADVKAAIAKCRAAGLEVGLHVLQTHIGMKSRYVKGAADPRLGIKRRFALARPIPAQGDVSEIEVLENPQGAVLAAKARVLKFGTELFSYEAYTRERPWKFTGVRRGAWETDIVAHPRGEIGGILDMSEFGCNSCYIDQTTDLQDEIAGKIAAFYNECGFSFIYFDGSEGVLPPVGVNVPLAQYRVYGKLVPEPLFAEGAAKGHFGWHMLSGANAFDVCEPNVFKEELRKWQIREAPIMREDFTRINFGWFWFGEPGRIRPGDIGMQSDMYEFGTSTAAAWDCPIQFAYDKEAFERHPRAKDVIETIRRWEDVRAKGWLTEKMKAAMRDGKVEHHLYLREDGEYELHPIEMLPEPEKAKNVRAFVFVRDGRTVLAYWNARERESHFSAPLGEDGSSVTLRAADRAYFETGLSVMRLKAAFAAAADVPIPAASRH